ncbi:MAG: hypothetical protein ACXVPQ_02045 [Bacteroidia bacterium]
MRFIIILILSPLFFAAQPFKRTLQNAGSFYYKQHCYAYGLSTEKNNLSFKIYRLSTDLKQADSLILPLGKEKAENYLEISTDTLHDYLNFYLQKVSSKNLASLVRLNDSLKLVSTAENFDVTKVNRITAFEDEKFWYGPSVYTIRTAADSSGKQFYLNRFDVVSAQKPFEYREKWQFPYEKQHINTAHVFYADSHIVLTYVTILSGIKKGQWILKLNAESGQLIKGVKLNPKGDVRAFMMSGFNYDKKTKALLVAGTIYGEAQVNYTNNTFTFAGLNKSNTFFFTLIDSLGENVAREEKNMPLLISNIKADPKKTVLYHVKLKDIRKKNKSDYVAYCSVFKSGGQELLFLYETGFYINFNLDEMGFELTPPEKIYSNSTALTGLVVPDPKDINGKMDLKTITDLDKLMYGQPLADVELYAEKDENGNPKWVLKKSDLKTATSTFYLVKVGLKGIENSVILESSKYNHPAIYKKNRETLILFSFDPAASVVEISLKTW